MATCLTWHAGAVLSSGARACKEGTCCKPSPRELLPLSSSLPPQHPGWHARPGPRALARSRDSLLALQASHEEERVRRFCPGGRVV